TLALIVTVRFSLSTLTPSVSLPPPSTAQGASAEQTAPTIRARNATMIDSLLCGRAIARPQAADYFSPMQPTAVDRPTFAPAKLQAGTKSRAPGTTGPP